MNTKLICFGCKKEFITYLWESRPKAKYCSNACKNTQVHIICKECGVNFKVRKYREFEAKFCSRKCWGQDFKKRVSGWNKGTHGIMPPAWNKGTKGIVKAWNKGKHFSEESKKRMSIAEIETYKNGRTKFWLGKKRPSMAGSNNWNWKGGVSKTKEYEAFLERHRNYLKKASGGKHTFRQWIDLKKKYNDTCPACFKKEPEIKLTEDHIRPLSLGGNNDISNIQPLCMICNTKKSTKEIKYEVAFWSEKYHGNFARLNII